MSENLAGKAWLAAPAEGEAASPEALRLVGRRLCGKWRLERLLGSGGMSSVYEAVHRNGKRVAVKVLCPDLTSNRQVRSRFVREGYIANRIDHPGRVVVLDDERDAELVFLVMELLEGETLAARARRHGGRLPPEEVVEATDGLLDVLAAAHASGVVHRDVKPANVFLTLSGHLKLLDFGVASLREISVGMNQTRSGHALGTPGFMAPEQARGRWSEVDARTDLWAVGATMYQLLCGQLVHPREYANETMIASATLPAPSLAVSRPDLPAALVALVDRALAFEPAGRWQSAREMQEEARRVRGALPAYRFTPPPPHAGLIETATVDDESATSPPTVDLHQAAAPTERPRRRWPLPTAVALAGGALVLLIGVAASNRPRAPLPPPAPAVTMAPPPVPAPAPVLAPAPEPAEAPAPPPVTPARRKDRGHHERRPLPPAPTPLSPLVTGPLPQDPDDEPAPPPERQPAPPLESRNVVSERPRDSIPPPQLASVYQAHGREDLARICQRVEDETVARAGVSPAFANGVTGALRHALETSASAEIYPLAMYYFIISEAALGHDRETAGHRLLATHKSRALRRLGNLVDRK